MARNERVCVRCEKSPTVESHLIPRAFAADIKGDQKNLYVGSRDHTGKTITQSGVYDHFLCIDCENAMHSYENEAINFIRGFSLTAQERAQKAFGRQDAPNRALVQFACSVLWRYHTSQRYEAEGVDVGAWEPVLRAVTFQDDLSQAPDVICSAIETEFMRRDGYALAPSKSEFDGRTVWQIVLNGFALLVKLDDRPFPEEAIRQIVLNHSPLLIGGVKFIQEEEFEEFRPIFGNMIMPGKLKRIK